jgi:outer membrane immunogenic protein
MRKVLTGAAVAAALAGTSSAFAADLPVKAPPVAPVVAPVYYNWTGCYIGGNVGAAWRGHDGWTDSRFGLTWGDDDHNGRFIGGGQIGCNYQINQFVIGAEWDADWTGRRDIDTTVFVPGVVGPVEVTGSGSAWVSTLAARFGVAFDRVLLYGKAGVGWVGASGDLTIANLRTGDAITISDSRSVNGWMVGAGVEWGFTENLSAKLEWDYLARSSDTFTVPLGSRFLPGDTFTTGNRNIQMIKLGLNWRFNWGGGAGPGPYRPY